MIKHYSSKRAMIDILSIKEQVIRAFKNERKYKPFLDFIFAKDYLNDDDIEFPSMKLISEAINLNYTQLSKLIKELYYRLFDDEVLNFKFDFKEVEIVFYIRYFDNYAQFSCKRMNYIPRVGEQVNMDFVNAKIGTSMFYVDRIEHSFESNKQIVYISLKSGLFNQYLYDRKHKAVEYGEIDFSTFYSGNEFDIREAIGLRKY
ncbi:MAG: hypothetical protein QM495_12160 [Lutibacter sp.]|uniref:hypothetical protein n=1 Tax=Lutibacter sp. TaxID=1925666 RepID=UPI00385CE1D8